MTNEKHRHIIEDVDTSKPTVVDDKSDVVETIRSLSKEDHKDEKRVR